MGHKLKHRKREKKHARGQSCAEGVLARFFKGESRETTLLREYMHVDRPPGYSLSC